MKTAREDIGCARVAPVRCRSCPASINDAHTREPVHQCLPPLEMVTVAVFPAAETLPARSSDFTRYA